MEASVSSSLVDDDFGPETRGRCYTWPMQQFIYDTVPSTALSLEHPPSSVHPSMSREPTVAQLLAATPSSSTAMGTHLMPLGMTLPPDFSTGHSLLPPKKKRCRKKPSDQLAQKKPNPWGEESYSDIIAKALESAPEGRLKLNEIYQWFSDNIPYFRERSSQEDAAGWKNSIRHNLSLHSRFMRIQNEGAGKSSWWVINPDAKPGRNPRRVRASTLDTTSKATLSKKLKGARKRIHEIRSVGGLHSGVSSLGGSQTSVMSHDIYGDDDAMQTSFDSVFRPRTQSNLSVPGSSTRVSPSMEHPFDDFDFPSWVNDAAAASTAAAAAAGNANHSSAAPIPTDILDRTDQIRIDSCRAMMNGVKQEPKPIKTEPSVAQPQPPSYLELSSVRNHSQLQNPLLRSQLTSVKFPGSGLPLTYQTYSPWPGAHHSPHLLPPSSCAAVAQANSVAAAAALPSDLESLTLPDQPLMDFEVESLLRHELSQTTDHRLNFDNL
uniref:Forkhead box protein O n=1 Tax=Angiostrongylus cantonensis TaxID=6313 RepID=A0A158P5Q2_ANGCA|nr:FOXO/DAF-16b transcription factor [Angiostrongylus cantonensis]